jgi:hypothetical protein
MNIGIIKKVVGFIVSLGVGSIITNAVKSTTPAQLGPIKKILIWVGSLVLGSMVVDQAVKYADDKIDHTALEIKKMVANGDI